MVLYCPMSELSPEIESTHEPFVIRAHHLKTLLESRHLEANTIAINYRMGISVFDDDRNETYDHTYYVDVYGTTRDERIKHETGMYDFLKTFWELPPDRTVQIATKRKDGICNSCIIGSHCDADLDVESDSENLMQGVMSSDMLFISKFERTAELLGFEDKYVKTIETTERSTGPVDSIVITADASVVKKVILYRDFDANESTIHPKDEIKQILKRDPKAKQARKDWLASSRASDKEYRRIEKARLKSERQANFDTDREFKRTLLLHRVSKMRPIISTIFIASGVSTIFATGQLYEDIVVDPVVKNRFYDEFENRSNDNLADVGLNGLTLLISGIAYSTWPRRSRVEDILEGRIVEIKPLISDSE